MSMLLYLEVYGDDICAYLVMPIFTLPHTKTYMCRPTCTYNDTQESLR